ncbi:hypothetical protein PLICRDRAFT_259176 [Plicaturopsis crispa FD-325 SS-3]|nr:hypothetical protein PLICRDRAFT_259176 [Plicaturopsis crispa FD-325 SS-3]
MIPEAFSGFALWRATDAGTLLPPSRELYVFVNTNTLPVIVALRRTGGTPMPVITHITRLDATILRRWTGDANPCRAFAHLTHVRLAFQHGRSPGDTHLTVKQTLEKHASIEVFVLSVTDTRFRYHYADFADWKTRDRMDGRLDVSTARNSPEERERVARDGGDILMGRCYPRDRARNGGCRGREQESW